MNDPLEKYRPESLRLFRECGLPTAKTESYKYSPLEKRLDVSSLEPAPFVKAPLNLSDDGIITGSIISFSEDYRPIFDKYFNVQASLSNNTVAALNTATASDGEVIFIPQNLRPETPFVITVKGGGLGRRDLIILEDNSSATVIVKHEGTSGTLNRLCEAFIGRNARLSIIEENITSQGGVVVNTLLASLSENAYFSHTAAIAQKGFWRNDIEARLESQGCECHLYGVTVACGSSHTDNTTVISHLAPGCLSHEHYKNVVRDGATAVFAGNIFVAEGAQKTEAYQKNNNILLSGEGTVHTKPSLVINADDVRCSHGATVGRLDDMALYYMRQRGIPLDEAKSLLLGGFVDEILEKVGDETQAAALSEKLQTICSI